MGARKVLGGVAGLSLVLALVIVMPAVPSQAAEVPYSSCPSGAASWVNNSESYPPFTQAGADSAAGLDNCAAPFAPQSSEQNVTMSFPFTGLPTDPCNTIVSVSITSTGTPDGAGWGFVAYNVDDPTIHYTGPTGTGDGSYQQFSATQGNLITTNGATFYTPIDQPASGQYSVTYQLDPAQLDLATLAAGKLAVAAVVFDPGDVLSQLTAQVVLDDSACTPVSSDTTASTSSSTSTTTTAPKVQAATSPKFTG